MGTSLCLLTDDRLVRNKPSALQGSLPPPEHHLPKWLLKTKAVKGTVKDGGQQGPGRSVSGPAAGRTTKMVQLVPAPTSQRLLASPPRPAQPQAKAQPPGLAPSCCPAQPPLPQAPDSDQAQSRALGLPPWCLQGVQASHVCPLVHFAPHPPQPTHTNHIPTQTYTFTHLHIHAHAHIHIHTHTATAPLQTHSQLLLLTSDRGSRDHAPTRILPVSSGETCASSDSTRDPKSHTFHLLRPHTQ